MAQKYQQIKRKDHIPDDVRTEGKDDAAEIIDTLIENGNWPVSLEELDDQTEWSRSHYRNVLKSHFERVDEPQDKQTLADQQITIPDDVDNVSDFLQGVAKGYNLAKME